MLNMQGEFPCIFSFQPLTIKLLLYYQKNHERNYKKPIPEICEY